MAELETVAILVQDKQAKSDASQVALDTLKADQAASELKATRAKWSKAGKNPLTVFSEIGVGAVVGIGDDGNVTRTEPNKILAMLGAGVAGTAGLAVAEGYCVLSVNAEDAYDLEQRYNLPKTLQWESQGRICYAFSESKAGCVVGDKVKLAGCRHGGASVLVYPPIEKAKFIVTPKEALPADSASLPGVPEKLLRLLNLVVGQSAKDVDRAILN